MQGLIQRFEPLWDVWRVVEELGSGSYGRVFKVIKKDSEKSCYAAVKEIVIPPSADALAAARGEGLDQEGAKSYFGEVLKNTLLEVELMKRLGDCPYIVRFQEHQIMKLNQKEEFGWVLLIRMELLVPFKSILLENDLSAGDVVRLGIHICRALEFCAQKGIVHRDLKPENLFYDPVTDTYKLGDFGIAHDLARPTEGKGRAGTLSHMPPEVYQGARFTAASDLYALGMILYRLLNGRRLPFLPPYPQHFTPGQRDKAMIKRLRGADPGPPCQLKVNGKESVRLGEIAQKAIAARPENRYPSAKALREALEGLCL